MYKPLRWYERLLLAWLAKSDRIDLILITQFPGDRDARRQALIRWHHDLDRERLETLFNKDL